MLLSRDPLGSERLTINRLLTAMIDVASGALWGTQQLSVERNDSSQQERQTVITYWRMKGWREEKQNTREEEKKKICILYVSMSERCGSRYQKVSRKWELLWSKGLADVGWKQKIECRDHKLIYLVQHEAGCSSHQGTAERESTQGIQLCRKVLRGRADGSCSSGGNLY